MKDYVELHRQSLPKHIERLIVKYLIAIGEIILLILPIVGGATVTSGAEISKDIFPDTLEGGITTTIFRQVEMKIGIPIN